jgi:hypothetical protein
MTRSRETTKDTPARRVDVKMDSWDTREAEVGHKINDLLAD